MSGNYHFDLSRATVGNVIAGDVHGNPTAIQLDCSPKQNLTEAAAEIQELIEQLVCNNPTITESENKVIVAEAIEQAIAQNPTLKERLRGALKAGGIEALKAIFNHPLISIPIETIKGWIEAE